jgi:hypothetical protein
MTASHPTVLPTGAAGFVVRKVASFRRLAVERDIGFEPTTFSLGSKKGGLSRGLERVVGRCKSARRLRPTEQRVPRNSVR